MKLHLLFASVILFASPAYAGFADNTRSGTEATGRNGPHSSAGASNAAAPAGGCSAVCGQGRFGGGNTVAGASFSARTPGPQAHGPGGTLGGI